MGVLVTATMYVGDAIEVMGKLPEKSVDLILTSPPFLALRSYLPADHPDKALEGGSQATPGEYIDWLIDVVEACDRVLAPHGSMCIELGDTYAGSGGAGGDYKPGGWREGQEGFKQNYKDRVHDGVSKVGIYNRHGYIPPGGQGWPLAKSLSLIPELFRLTLVYGTNPLTGRTTDRWRLRNVVRWVRPNPPVGALGDKFRPATSELMVFCKSAKRYFDLDAVREPYKPGQSGAALSFPANFRGTEKGRRSGGVSDQIAYGGAGAPPLDWWMIADSYANKSRLTVGKIREAAEFASVSDSEQDTLRRAALVLADLLDKDTAGAPPLDWWNIPPGGYEGAHYAVFPPELCIKPIKAMSPERVCRQCGEPSRRIVEYSYDSTDPSAWGGRAGWSSPRPTAEHQREDRLDDLATKVNPSAQAFAHGRAAKIVNTTGFTDCGHDDWRPGLVLDPFGGSGTTALVATGHGRDCILIDLDERNFDLALERVGPFILERAG